MNGTAEQMEAAYRELLTAIRDVAVAPRPATPRDRQACHDHQRTLAGIVVGAAGVALADGWTPGSVRSLALHVRKQAGTSLPYETAP